MKITVLSENLQKALTLVNRAVSSRNQLPILAHVLLETREGKLFISTTDLEIGIETSISASVEEEGSTTVLAKLFLELLNTLPAGKITMETKDGNMTVVGAKTKTVLQTTPSEEFPKLYENKGKKILSLPGKEMLKEIRRVVFTASIESTRPALSGILLKKTEEGMLLVATDGYRLSLEKISLPKESEAEGSIIIPAKLVREIMALKEEDQIDIYVDSTQNQVLFSQNETVIVGRLIEAEFPNYEKILPTDAASTITIDKESFLRAVKTCAIFARETANIITLTLAKGKMVVSSKTPSLGENVVEVDAVLTGEENAIAFNAKYLLDFLTIIDGQDICFEMTGPLNSGVFRISGDDNYLHLIMPIRTQG